MEPWQFSRHSPSGTVTLPTQSSEEGEHTPPPVWERKYSSLCSVMVMCWSYLDPVLRPQPEGRTAAGGEDGLLVFPGETVRPRLLGLTLRHRLAQSYKIFEDIQFKIGDWWDDKSEYFLQSSENYLTFPYASSVGVVEDRSVLVGVSGGSYGPTVSCRTLVVLGLSKIEKSKIRCRSSSFDGFSHSGRGLYNCKCFTK